MSLIKCHECQKEISESAVTCIHCGYKLKVISHKSKNVLVITIVILVFLGIVGYGIYQYVQDNKELNKQHQIYDNLQKDINDLLGD